ncbi:MAG: response regulator [Rhodanobacter sp.]
MDTRKTLLIVDDNPLVLESIDLLLCMTESFNTIRALGTAGADSHLKHARIDIIVADVILAGSSNGIELCRMAIERYPRIAMVVITADNEIHREDIPKRGIFLRKPFGGKQLLQAIDGALERSRQELHG